MNPNTHPSEEIIPNPNKDNNVPNDCPPPSDADKAAEESWKEKFEYWLTNNCWINKAKAMIISDHVERYIVKSSQSGKERAALEKLVHVQDNYIKFLDKESGRFDGLAYAHGMKYPDDVVEAGKRHREAIEQARQALSTDVGDDDWPTLCSIDEQQCKEECKNKEDRQNCPFASRLPYKKEFHEYFKKYYPHLIPRTGEQDELWREVFSECSLPIFKEEVEALKSKYTLTRK